MNPNKSRSRPSITTTTASKKHHQGMVASSIFITDLAGKAIISRDYRGEIPLTQAIDRFAKYLGEIEDDAMKPVFQVDANGDIMPDEDVGSTGAGGHTFVYVQVRDALQAFKLHWIGRLDVFYWHVYDVVAFVGDCAWHCACHSSRNAITITFPTFVFQMLRSTQVPSCP
jgi:hypothetical protein